MFFADEEDVYIDIGRGLIAVGLFTEPPAPQPDAVVAAEAAQSAASAPEPEPAPLA